MPFNALAPHEPPLDLTRFGFRRVELATGCGRMQTFRKGDGPSLILLHGIGGGASSYYWARLAPLLSGAYSVCAVDFVGWGDSEHPARFLLFEDYVEQITAIVDAVGPVQGIVAQGLAAGFAIEAVRRRPRSAVGRLALLAPTGGRDFGKDAFDPLFAWTLGVLARCRGLNMALYRRYFHRRSAYSFWFERRGFFDASAVPPDLVDAGLRCGSRTNAAYSALPFVGGSLRYDLAPLLRAIDRPVLMMWGEHEQQIDGETRARLARLQPAIRAVNIPRTRTNFESEAPAQTAECLLGFLSESP